MPTLIPPLAKALAIVAMVLLLVSCAIVPDTSLAAHCIAVGIALAMFAIGLSYFESYYEDDDE